jgi:hypothetical protein
MKICGKLIYRNNEWSEVKIYSKKIRNQYKKWLFTYLDDRWER